MRIAPLLGVLLLLAPTAIAARSAVPPAPRASAAASVRLAEARETLHTALVALAAAPSRARLAAVHRAMQAIQAGLDAYFHGAAPKTPAARATAAALRTEVMRLLGGAEPTLVVSDDVLRFQPALHRRLAALALQLGEFRDAIEHLRAAQVVDGSRPEDLRALLAAHRGAGDAGGAAAVEAELQALTGTPATETARP